MSYSSELTKERIILSAKEEFLKKGFVNANLREIAKKAKVTTGALYNHFKNKESVFEAVVGSVADELFTLFDEAHKASPQHIIFSDDSKREEMKRGSFEVLDYIYDNLEEAKLIFFHSRGTKYENFIEKMIEIEEESSLKELKGEGFTLDKINRFFVHVMATSGVTNMIEAIHHGLSRKEAFEYMEKIQKFYYAGTKEIVGN